MNFKAKGVMVEYIQRVQNLYVFQQIFSIPKDSNNSSYFLTILIKLEIITLQPEHKHPLHKHKNKTKVCNTNGREAELIIWCCT